MASKTMHFYAYGLQKDTTVMMVFEPPSKAKLFKDQFPVVWSKGHHFPRQRPCESIDSLWVPAGFWLFPDCKLDQDNLVDSGAWVEVKSGDISRIQGEPGQKRFGEVTKASGTKLLVCKNNTDARANISIGFVRGDGYSQRYEPTLIWTGVGSGSNVTAQFTPNLTAYVTRDYKATEMLRGEVETDAIWTCNLNELDDVTGWNFVEDDASGEFRIERSIQV
ncbi:unnamed protein product [Rhizoctonia solani]|uniref:Uncharacterized protein n=1 Tax=Rhizoctonia solani TaxID=456999 RepID=A0A8H2ZYX4_9AGAM|nr:unnamed protein product [Rhizoctonia solani]